MGASTQRSQRGSTPSFRVENCTTVGTGAVRPHQGHGSRRVTPALCLAWSLTAQPCPRGDTGFTQPLGQHRGSPQLFLYHQQPRWLLLRAPPSAGTRSPAPATPAAACPGRTSPGTAGDRRCPASARHSQTRDFSDRAHCPHHSLQAVARPPSRGHIQPTPGVSCHHIPPWSSPAAGGCSC